MTKHHYTKRQIVREVKNFLLVIFGSLLVAIGAAFFIEPSGLVTGGVTTLGIILNTVFADILNGFNIVDIVVWVAQILLWSLGFFALGKQYAMRTLIATIMFPLFNTILLRFVQPYLVNLDIGFTDLYGPLPSYKLLVALFGGLFVGAGVSVAYLGNGSTGGLDIIAAVASKWFGIKEGIVAFALDGILVFAGLFVYQNIIYCLIGVISAMIMGITISYIYTRTSMHVIVEIISKKYQDIQKYISEEMDHSTTEIRAVGGYSQQDIRMLRAVIYHTEQLDLKKKIAEIDPDAFVVVTTARAINGEGFDPLYLGHNTERKPKK
ncbi:MAG: YitT family protein [Bacilli bacterium]|nr:YitT family protein [Bacilli bacterium]